MNKFNKQDLVQIVADAGHLSKRDAKTAVDLTFDLIEEAILEDRQVNITNFGVFIPKTKQERGGTDPRNHEPIVIKRKNTVVFKPARQLKEKLNK